MNPDYFRSIRRASGLSARALAELTNGALSRNVIADFENRRTTTLSLDAARRVAEVFGITLQCLIDESLNPLAIGIAYKLRQETDEIREDVAVLLLQSVKESQR